MADMLYGLEGLNLTPQELNKVIYHRQNLSKPFIMDGSPVTIYATGIRIPEGKYKGQFVSVPGYVGGKVVEDEQELWKLWKKDIEAGKWPVYKSSKELNARDAWLHQVMDKDIQNWMKTQKPYEKFDSLFWEDSPLR